MENRLNLHVDIQPVLRKKLAEKIYIFANSDASLYPQPMTDFAEKVCINFNKHQFEQVADLLNEVLVISDNALLVKDFLNKAITDIQSNKSITDIYDKLKLSLENVRKQTQEQIKQVKEIKKLQTQIKNKCELKSIDMLPIVKVLFDLEQKFEDLKQKFSGVDLITETDKLMVIADFAIRRKSNYVKTNYAPGTEGIAKKIAEHLQEPIDVQIKEIKNSSSPKIQRTSNERNIFLLYQINKPKAPDVIADVRSYFGFTNSKSEKDNG